MLIHAVSVGEVSALRELIRLLVQGRALHVILSVGTGHGIADPAKASDTCDIVRYPDFSWAVRRSHAMRPDAVAVVELEIWPNFAVQRAPGGWAADPRRRDQRAPERCSFRGYRPLRWFFRPSFRRLRSPRCRTRSTRPTSAPWRAQRALLRDELQKWDSARIADDVPGSADLARGIARGEGSGGEGSAPACCRGQHRRGRSFEACAGATSNCLRPASSSTSGSSDGLLGAMRPLRAARHASSARQLRRQSP